MLKHIAIVACVGGVIPALAIAEDAPAPLDLLNFAQGVLPVSLDTGGQDLRIDVSHVLSTIDGNPVKFVVTPRPGTSETTVEMILAMPSFTTFDRFAVPGVLETPSPSQTFFRTVQVLGSTEGVEGPYTLLAEGELTRHAARGEVSDLSMTGHNPAVLWVKLKLAGGIDVQTDAIFFEFSEIIGNGRQAPQSLSDRFNGTWKGRGVKIELMQEGALVSGCYDGRSRLSGTVDGTVLRALGADDAGVPSQFILIADDKGALRGVRSTNGAPFRPYDGSPSDAEPVCLPSEPEMLGCGDTVYGIGFGFDSAAIRPGSEGVLDSLFAGLSADGAARVQIIGHSSSEGAADYNRALSERRATSVVEALAARGIDPQRMTPLGMGEDAPIASNDDEAGRSLNRRVEIQCLP